MSAPIGAEGSGRTLEERLERCDALLCEGRDQGAPSAVLDTLLEGRAQLVDELKERDGLEVDYGKRDVGIDDGDCL